EIGTSSRIPGPRVELGRVMKTRKILLAGNWKMNHGPKETARFLESAEFAPKAQAEMRLYVPYLSLETAMRIAKTRSLPLEVGAQNAHFEKSGAYTAEISVPMLQEMGVRHVLIGHSERRQYFNETDETVLK